MSIEHQNFTEANIPKLIEQIKENQDFREQIKQYLIQHQDQVDQIRQLQTQEVDKDTLVRILVITKALLKAEETLETDEQTEQIPKSNPLVTQSGELAEGLLPLISKFTTKTKSGNLNIRNSQGQVVGRLTSSNYIYIDFMGPQVTRNQTFTDPKTGIRHTYRMVKIRNINSMKCQKLDYWTCFDLLEPEINTQEFQTQIRRHQGKPLPQPTQPQPKETQRPKPKPTQQTRLQSRSLEFEEPRTEHIISQAKFNLSAQTKRLPKLNLKETSGAINAVKTDIKLIEDITKTQSAKVAQLATTQTSNIEKLQQAQIQLRMLEGLITQLEAFIKKAKAQHTKLSQQADKRQEKAQQNQDIKDLKLSFLSVQSIPSSLEKEVIPHLRSLDTWETINLQDIKHMLEHNIKDIKSFQDNYNKVYVHSPRAITIQMKRFEKKSDDLITENQTYIDEVEIAIHDKQNPSPPETIEVASK